MHAGSLHNCLTSRNKQQNICHGLKDVYKKLFITIYVRRKKVTNMKKLTKQKTAILCAALFCQFLRRAKKSRFTVQVTQFFLPLLPIYRTIQTACRNQIPQCALGEIYQDWGNCLL